MAQIKEYSCGNCGMEFVDDGRLFYYDSNSDETIDFIWLFSTVGIDEGSKIKGQVNETYCSSCNKFLRVYTIREVEGDLEGICEIVKIGIENYFNKLNDEINHLTEIKNDENFTIEQHENYYLVEFPQLEDYEYTEYTSRAKRENIIKRAIKDYQKEINNRIRYKKNNYDKHLNSIYLIEDKSGEIDGEYNPLEKVNCPECGKEINKYINWDTPCPKCGAELLIGNIIMAD